MVQYGPRWSKLNCLLLTALLKLLNSIVSINKIKLEAQLLNSIVKSHFTNFGAWGNSNFFTIAFVRSKNHFVQKKKENRWRPCLTFFTITLFDNFSVINSLYWNLLKRLKSTVSMLPSWHKIALLKILLYLSTGTRCTNDFLGDWRLIWWFHHCSVFPN